MGQMEYIFVELDEREEERKDKRAVDLQPAVVWAPKSYVRVYDGSCRRKIVLPCSSTLYMLAITLAIDDMVTCYSHRSAIYY